MNRLMRKGKTEVALAQISRIDASITRFNSAALSNCDRKISAFDLWDVVNKLNR